MKRIALILGFLTWLGATEARATPGLMSFTGQLSTVSGPVDGPVGITFEIFDAPKNGTSVWREMVEDVTADLGRVAVTLGQKNLLGDSVFPGAERYLEVTVEGETLSPRLSINSVPYAIRSRNADSSETTADPTVQRRTATNMSCPPGQYLRAIDPSGNATCTPVLLCAPVQNHSSATKSLTVICPPGSIATGGGCNSTGTNIPIQDSFPAGGTGWFCQLSTSGSLTAFAVCCNTQ